MNKKSFWKGFAVGGLLFILLISAISYNFIVQPDVSLNQLKVSDLNGNKVNLTEFIGKPLVINYWATWCAPCIKEFPHFEELKKQAGENVNFIMISDESVEKINKFSMSKPYTFKYLKSEKDLEEYGIIARPTTYFYNSKGNLITKYTSNLDVSKLTELIEMIK
jgi:thiol-disulfide isomerase/thioredoxin